MNLIDLYVAEVGKRLLMRGRGDIEAELRSTLQDMLEDRSKKAGRPADEAMVLDLLKEYGPPDKVAATYDPHPHLIGPRIYPFFVKVLKIVLAVLTSVLVILLAVKLGTQPMTGQEAARAIVEGLLGIVQAAVAAFGNVALVFAILERTLPASEFKVDEETKSWDPTLLARSPEPESLKPWEPIAAIALTAAALIIFNGYADLIGIHFEKDGIWTSAPLLTEAFFRWLPYINVVWALQLALNVVLLRQGRWQAATRWTSIVLDAAGVALGYMLLTGPSIVAVSAETLMATGVIEVETATLLSTMLPQAARWVIIIVMIAEGVDVVKAVVKQLLRRP